MEVSFILKDPTSPMNVCFNVQCNPAIMLSDVSVVGYQYMKMMEIRMCVRNQVCELKLGPYDIWWLMLMCLWIKFEPVKNIFRYQLDILIFYILFFRIGWSRYMSAYD